MPRTRTTSKRKPAAQGKSTAVQAKSPIARELDPIAPRARKDKAGTSKRKPPVKAQVRDAGGTFGLALLRRFIDADLLTQAAALAFYAVLSLSPLLLLLLWLTASLLPSAQDALASQIGALAGVDAERVARTVLASAAERPDLGSVAGWWSVALLFVGATAVFAQLQDSLNRIFRTEAANLASIGEWMRKRVFSFGLVFALGFLLLVSMTLNTALQLVFSRIEWLLPVLASLASVVVYALGFTLMFHYLPDRRVGWRRASGGGLLTAALFVLGRAGIGWYLQQTDPGSAYGSMGSLVLAVVWIYYAGLVVYAGALLTAVIDERATARAG